MRRLSKIIGSYALIASFGLFNNGLPVVLYLCPMMSSTPSTCPMLDETGNGLSIVNQTPSCCGKVIVAERNTIPFVKAQQPECYKISSIVFHSFDLQKYKSIPRYLSPVESPPPGEAQLYLLHSTLLI